MLCTESLPKITAGYSYDILTISSADTILIKSRANPEFQFGYVVFADKASADKAVSDLNNTVLDDATIAVEYPRPPRANGDAPRPRRRRRPAASGAEGDAAAAPAPAGERKPRQRKPRAEAPATEGDAPAAEGDTRPARPRRRRRAAPTDAVEGETVERPARAPRRPRLTPEELAARADSSSDLFVANLPFAVDDAALVELFRAFNVTSAKVAAFRGRSKGYGFVHFEKSEDAQNAQKSKDDEEISGRKIVVRFAKVRPEPEATA